MTGSPTFTFKTAREPAEFEAIHRLNHRTFTGEIPQHAPTGDGRLIDKFHDQNTYLICLAGNELAGMVALRFTRPFSLDTKLADLDSLLPAGHTWCEVRLLAVEPKFRGSPVLAGLLKSIRREASARGVTAGIISATTRQLKLYRHLGFIPFGPLVGSEGAWYQPMHVSMETFASASPALASTDRHPAAPVNFLPGPVALAPPARKAFHRPPVSHRSPAFIDDVQAVRRELCRLTGANYAQFTLGSGTLANEIVCGQISRLESPGLVISSGEFGERLADQARRSWLHHEHLCLPWGHSLDLTQLERLLDRHPEFAWIWTPHCETSTGALTPLDELAALCASRGIRLAIDAISTIGTLPVDLSRVWMASCASGKALAAYPGLAIVLHNETVDPSPEKLPRYLDLGLYAGGDGIPFTISSNLVHALKASLENTAWPEKFARIRRQFNRIRPHLADLGATFTVAPEHSSPAVISLPMPNGKQSLTIAGQLEREGFLLSCRSAYLSARNWLQVCLMGEVTDSGIERFLGHLDGNNPWREGNSPAPH